MKRSALSSPTRVQITSWPLAGWFQRAVHQIIINAYRTRFWRQMSTHCCFRHFAPILRCSNAAGFARVPQLGQRPQTLDTARAHLDQSSAQLLEPTRADLAKPTDTTLLRAGFALSRPTRCQRAHTREEVRTGRCQSVSNSCCSDAESLSLKPDARAPSPADFRQIDQSSVRETAPDCRKPFPYAMAVNSNFQKNL